METRENIPGKKAQPTPQLTVPTSTSVSGELFWTIRGPPMLCCLWTKPSSGMSCEMVWTDYAPYRFNKTASYPSHPGTHLYLPTKCKAYPQISSRYNRLSLLRLLSRPLPFHKAYSKWPANRPPWENPEILDCRLPHWYRPIPLRT